MTKRKPGPRPGKGGKKKVVSLSLSPVAIKKLEGLKGERSASEIVEKLILAA